MSLPPPKPDGWAVVKPEGWKMTTELIDYDSAEHFKEPAAQTELLQDAIQQGDAGYLAHALGIIARARGMTQMERDTGMKRQALYRALATDGNPTLATVMKVLKALDLQIKIEPRVAA
ncbi:addiction module antidote protein [Sphingomonas nostoxanthinifaciens]|uniref:addiction module antidote protein n=1 Tax=Sphingomonas nostoxanthinifaciens TaxID=2872652 RepID=UPI001CC1CB16|nr:addiction module antidote protein [Sphingomonas nostoxanthinifaciens]UAK24168.1 putative addiction module antidote protein [Sphingomonas nostoxanthinifaciens]